MFQKVPFQLYLNSELVKLISNPFCTKTIVECPEENDIRSLSISSMSDNFQSESIQLLIDLHQRHSNFSANSLQTNLQVIASFF